MPRPKLQGMWRHLNKQSRHEQMREYYNSLPTMEEKADFLFSLNYMQLSGQLTSEEQGVFKELQTDYFFPLASDGQLDFPLHMMRLKSFHQRQIRLQEEMGQMVWAQLTPEERDQLRRYHEELKYLEELDEKNKERIKNGEIPLPPLDHDPVFPKSVANKMAQVYFRTPEGAAYQSMSSMSFMLTNVSEPRLKNYLQSHHISEDDYYDGGMESDMQSKVRDQVVIQDTMWESTHHTYDGFRLDPQQDQLSLMEGYQMIGRYMFDTGLPKYDAFSYKQRSENTMVAEEALNDRIDRTFLGEPPAEPIHFINTACDKTEALDQREADNIFHKKLLSRYGVPNVFEVQSHNETEEMARDRIRRMKRLADTAHAYIQAQEDPEARREIRNQINGWIDQGQLNNNEGPIYMKLLQGEYFLKTSDGLQMLEEYHNCKTPRERAEFLDRAMVLEQSGLLTEDEVDAVNRIQSEFLGPMKNGQLDMEAARENVLAFRRITAAADLRLGAKRQQMEEELPARIKGRDRRKIADYLVAHTTIEGAMKKRRDAFFSAMRNFYTKRDGERMAQACEWVDETVIAEKGLMRKKGLDLMQDAVRVGNEADTMPKIQGVFHKSEVYKQEAKNVVLRTCAAGIYPTWRGDHVWKYKDNDAFRAEAASRLKVPQGYKVTEQMVKDLIRLKDELKDANRFFYVNGDEYNNLVRAMEELTQVFESQPGRNVAFDSQKGQKEMLGLLQQVDAAAGEYIQTHLASRRSRHGERRFNVALMTNAILNPEANRVYTRMTELARSETINYQKLGNRLGLKTKVEHPNHRPKMAAQPNHPEGAAQPQMAAQSH